jgi:AraC family transcriptional regulator
MQEIRNMNSGSTPTHVLSQLTARSAHGLDEPRVLTNQLLLSQKIKSWSELEIARYRFPPGERRVSPLSGHIVRLHQSEPHYLVQRLDGRTRAGTETTGLITIIPARHPFEQVFQVESEDLNIVLPDRVIRRAAADANLDPGTLEILDHFCAEDPYVRYLGLALGAELDGDSLGEELYAESVACALAIHLVRKYSTHCPAPEPAVTHRLSPQILTRVTEYIDAYIDQRLSLAELGGIANLSPYHFSRLFKATTGRTPYQYVVEQRVRRARELLVNTDLPIHEIASQCGFSDQSHLGRHVRRRYGVTPGMLRT